MPKAKTSTKKEEKKYHLTIGFNDQVFEFDTDNLAESIASVSPLQLKTRVLIKVVYGDLVCEKMLLLLQGKRLFRNKVALEVFVNKLIFTKNG